MSLISKLISILVFGKVYGFLVDDGILKVSTGVGDLVGYLSNVEFDSQISQAKIFRGIPYAKPPVGDLRFRKPEPLKRLPNSPFKAMDFGPVCPQSIAKLYGYTSSEDCLYLNIYTPVSSDSSSLKAVMVWIHGGGFVIGSSNYYDSSILSIHNDVVVVTLNYRLGPLGFFSSHDQNAAGNFGLWDQQLAIKWVRDNIANFGGDPDNISIFGESAGGSSVIYQTLYPGNQGLVKRAIAQSGTVSAWGLVYFDTSEKDSKDFAHFTGCNETSSYKTLLCLRSKSEADIKQATESYMEQYLATPGRMNAFAPLFDNDFVKSNTGTILDELSDGHISKPFAQTFCDIDLMIGDTNFDGAALLGNWLGLINVTSGLFDDNEFSWQQFYDTILPNVAKIALKLQNPTDLIIDALKFEYTAWDDLDNATRRLQTLIDMTTDFTLNAPSVQTANAHQRGTKATYVYQFSTAPPGLSLLPIPPVLQSETAASHSDELVFIFGFPETFQNNLRFNRSDITHEQWAVSKEMMAMWSNFAKTG